MLVYAVLCGKSELSVVLQSGCQGCFSYFFSFGHWSVGFWWMTPRLAEATQRRSKTRTAAWRTPCAATAPSACRRRGVDVDGRGRWETHRETRCYPVIISCRVSVHFVFTFCSLCVHFVFLVVSGHTSCSTRCSSLFYRIQHEKPAKPRGSELWLSMYHCETPRVFCRRISSSLWPKSPYFSADTPFTRTQWPSRGSRVKTCQHHVP